MSDQPRIFTSTDNTDLLIHVCWICGNPTGVTSHARSHLLKPGQIADANNHAYRNGLCPEHHKMHLKGHTSFISETRGVMLELRANELLQEEYRGQVIHIPEDKMDEVLGLNKTISSDKDDDKDSKDK